MENVDNIVAKGEIACFKQFLQNCSKDFNSIDNFGCSGIRKGAKCPNFKKSSPPNLFVRFQYNLLEMLLG